MKRWSRRWAEFVAILAILTAFLPAAPPVSAGALRPPAASVLPLGPAPISQHTARPPALLRSSIPPASFQPQLGHYGIQARPHFDPPTTREDLISRGRRSNVSSYQCSEIGIPPFTGCGTADKGNNGIYVPTESNEGWWRSIGSGSFTQQWWRLDLGKTYTMTKVMTYWDDRYLGVDLGKKYKIEVSSNGTSFTTVVDRTASYMDGNQSDTFSATAARYLRILVTGTETTEGIHHFTLMEADVYGTIALEPDTTSCDEDCPGSGAQEDTTNPINTRTGNLWTRATDLVVASAPFRSQTCSIHALEFTRTYNSQQTDEITGTAALGYGWQHVYATRLITESMPGGEDDLVIILTPFGNRQRFQELPEEEAGRPAGTFYSFPGGYSSLIYANGIYTQTMQDNSQILFNALGKATAMIDPQGHRLNLIYNGSGKLTTVRDALSNSRALTFTYDVTGTHILTATDGVGRSIGYRYTGDDLTQVIDELGRVTTYEYQNHLLIKIKNPLNQVVEHTAYDVYTSAGKAISQTLQSGEQLRLQYGAASTTITTTVSGLSPQVEVIGYDAGNMATTRRLNGTLLQESAYDEHVAPGTLYDGNRNLTTSVWNNAGKPLTITNALGQSASIVYDSLNRPITVTSELGTQTRYDYDTQNNITRQITGIVPGFSVGFTTLYTYTTPYAPNSTIRYLERTRAPNGVVTRYQYSPLVHGQLITTTMAFGTSFAVTSTVGYDQFSRVVTTTMGVGTAIVRSDVTRYNLDNTVQETIQNYKNGLFDQAKPDEDIRVFTEYDALSRPVTTTIGYGSILATKQVTRYNSKGQVTETIRNYQDGTFSVANPDQDVKTLYAYDGLGRTVFVTQTGILTGTFNTTTRQFSGHTTRTSHTAYDELSRPVTVTLNYQDGVYNASYPDVDVQTVTRYDTAGNVIGQRDALGRWTTYELDELNRVVKTIVNYENGDPTSIETENESWATYNDTDIISVNVYDDQGRLERTIENYFEGEFWYSNPITDRITLYQYDELDRVITVTHNLSDPVGLQTDTNRVSVTQYDALSRVVGQRDPLGNWANTQYDILGRASLTVGNCRNGSNVPVATGCASYSSTNPDRNVPSGTSAYDAIGRAHEHTNQIGVVSHTTYDGLSRGIISIQNYVAPGTPTSAITNVTTLHQYDALGRTNVMTDAVGAVTRYGFDGLGQTVVVTDSVGRVSRMGYDSTGQRWSETPDGRFSVSLIDGLGRVVRTVQNYQDGTVGGSEPADQDLITRTVYDVAGRVLQQVDAAGTVTSFTYDLRDQLLSVVENDQASCSGGATDCDVTTQYRYDRVGNRTALVDARGNTRRWTYDAADRQVTATDALTRTTAWQYDLLDRVILQDDPRGPSSDLKYTYDGLGQTVTISATSFTQAITQSYDLLGRRASLGDDTGTTSFSYDRLSRVTQVVAPTTGAVAYQYNARGQRTGLTYPDSTAVLYSYFADGQLQAVTQTSTLLASYSYDSVGRLAAVSRTNGTTTSYTYDRASRLTTLQTTTDGTTLGKFDYTLDRLGNRTVVTDTVELGQLLKDISTGGSASGTPSWLTTISGTLYFQANDGTHGSELWTSDGTSGGTAMLVDIAPGSAGSSPNRFVDVNGTIFFEASDNTHGFELWKTDGTSSGTVMVKDLRSGGLSGSPSLLTNVNGTLFFICSDGTNGTELWKSDGTSSGTVLVKDINTGGGSANPSGLINLSGTLYFAATDGSNGVELWKSDGTSSGTTLVKDINTTSGASSNPTGFLLISGTLYFVATDGSNGVELWKSDGTTSGTTLVKDINTTSGASSSPTTLTNMSGTLYFAATDGSNGVELWKSDGTSSGTSLVKDINTTSGASSTPANLTAVGTTLFFTANESTNGVELWKSDGTSSGTSLVKDINAGSSSANPLKLTNANGTLFFQANNGVDGAELWKSDGTSSGTSLVKDINSGAVWSSPSSLTAINGLLAFVATDSTNGTELWGSDGTTVGTRLVADINNGTGGSNPSALAVVNGRLYFAADNVTNGNEVWSWPFDVQRWPTNQHVTRYTYDDLSRLTNAHESGVSASTYYSYTYDLAGNRLSSKKNADATISLSYDAADQVSTGGWSYDAAGNLLTDGTSTFTYNALGRVLSATKSGTTSTNRYNGDGVLVRQKVGASTYLTYTQDLVAGLSQILQQKQNTATTNYLYGHERLASVLSGTRTWYHADALGSVRMTTNNYGLPVDVLRYDPWGMPVEDTPSPFGFTGELQDNAAGLVYLRARWYQPGTGTLLGRDPFVGNPQTPYSQHYYQYGYSDPILLTDPTGNNPCHIPGGLARPCPNPGTNNRIGGTPPVPPGEELTMFDQLSYYIDKLSEVQFSDAFDTQGLQADWWALYAAWFFETTPKVGEWTTNYHGYPTVIIRSESYAYDLRSRPHYKEVVKGFQQRYRMNVNPGDSYQKLFEFTGPGTTTGEYNLLEWFLGSYMTYMNAISVDRQNRTVSVEVIVYNVSHWESGTRVPNSFQDVFGEYLVNDRARNQGAGGLLYDLLIGCTTGGKLLQLLGVEGFGGDYAQAFIFYDTIRY